MFKQSMNAQKISDKISIAASMLCLIHCLVLPSFLVIFSSYISLSLDIEIIHYMLLFLVIPTSVFALTLGLKNHNNIFVFLLGLVGIASLIFALFTDMTFLNFSGEILFTTPTRVSEGNQTNEIENAQEVSDSPSSAATMHPMEV